MQEKYYALSKEELDEFKRLAGEAAAIPKAELAKTAPPLTMRLFMEFCALVYEVTSAEDISGIPIGELYRRNKMIGMNEALILSTDPDSPAEFAAAYNATYHNEELWFGGPKLYIYEEGSRDKFGCYTYPYEYREWTGRICLTMIKGKKRDLFRGVKMFNALRKRGLPIYFYDYEQVFDECVRQFLTDK